MQIDILIVNCSLFNPTPSLSAMVVNHFKMRSNTITYNLGGMGCSAGVIAVGLARELLQVTRQVTQDCKEFSHCSMSRWPGALQPGLAAPTALSLRRWQGWC